MYLFPPTPVVCPFKSIIPGHYIYTCVHWIAKVNFHVQHVSVFYLYILLSILYVMLLDISEICNIPINNNLFIQKGMKASAVRDNVIRGLKVKKSTSSVENPDDYDDSGIDALSEVEDRDKEKREKSTEVAKEFEEHKEHSKRDLLPSEVCF